MHLSGASDAQKPGYWAVWFNSAIGKLGLTAPNIGDNSVGVKIESEAPFTETSFTELCILTDNMVSCWYDELEPLPDQFSSWKTG